MKITKENFIEHLKKKDENAEEVYAWLNNENGEHVENIGLWELPDYGDDFGIGCMVPVTSGYVTASFFDKNNTDENGNIINTKEIKINMEDVIAHLNGGL